MIHHERMSRVWRVAVHAMRHVIFVDDSSLTHVTCLTSCHTDECVMSHMRMHRIKTECVMSHRWMRHVTHEHASYQTYDCVMSHIWMRHVTDEWMTAHTWMSHSGSWHVWIRHVTHVNTSCHTCVTRTGWAIWTSVLQRVAVCCSVSQCVAYATWIHMNAYRHSYESVMSH